MAALRTTAARFAGNDGAELIEFALTYPLLLLVVFGIIDFGLLFQQHEVITNAAREGARIAILEDFSSADAQARAQQYLDAALIRVNGTPTVTVSAPFAMPIGTNCMTAVTVTVSYPHEYLFVGGVSGLFGSSLGTKTLTASATMRTEANAGACP